MERVTCVAIILETIQGDVLLSLRDNKATTVFPNHWTLVGGRVENGETPEMAAHRELAEETGLKTSLSFWKRYEREHPLFVIDQHIYTGKLDVSSESLILGEGRAIQFFGPGETRHLKIGYGFKAVLLEYFLSQNVISG
jgi:8-oxo-dGTP pyrophosphatase MutT (NUDIX family)